MPPDEAPVDDFVLQPRSFFLRRSMPPDGGLQLTTFILLCVALCPLMGAPVGDLQDALLRRSMPPDGGLQSTTCKMLSRVAVCPVVGLQSTTFTQGESALSSQEDGGRKEK